MQTGNGDVSRYTALYRSREIALICEQAKRGESLCLVGLAGCGKSNLIKFLREDDEAKSQYLGDVTQSTHFPDVDIAGWDGIPRTLWNRMNGALVNVLQAMDVPEELQRGIPFERLTKTLCWLCQDQEHRVMFLLDEFDDVLRDGPRTVFEQLSTLRSAGNRERLSFLVFTRKLPHVLGRRHELEHHSKFYDLFRYNIYALPLHNKDDSERMLAHLNATTKSGNNEETVRLTDAHVKKILELAGGHARLIKVMFESWPAITTKGEITTERIAEESVIQDECKRILFGLHRQEREVAVRLANNRNKPADDMTIDHLCRRELINPDRTFFSPLMAIFLKGKREADFQ